MIKLQKKSAGHKKAGIFAPMKSKTYDERKEAKRYSVLTGNGEVIGLWGNLKKLCEEMKEQDGEFLGYSALSKRRADENPIRFKTDMKDYAVWIEKIR